VQHIMTPTPKQMMDAYKKPVGTKTSGSGISSNGNISGGGENNGGDEQTPNPSVTTQVPWRDIESDSITVAQTMVQLRDLSHIKISTVGSQYRIYGTRANRAALGLRPYVNNVNVENWKQIFRPLGVDSEGLLAEGAIRGLGSRWTAGAYGLEIGWNISDHINGYTTRGECASALIFDTGALTITVAASGAVDGFFAGEVVAPPWGGPVGAVAGLTTALIMGTAYSAMRDDLIEAGNNPDLNFFDNMSGSEVVSGMYNAQGWR
jgi:hypothetical protein